MPVLLLCMVESHQSLILNDPGGHMNLHNRILYKLSLALGLISFLVSSGSAQEPADTIYLGGTIITVNDEAPRAEAVAVKDGMILAVGSADDLASYRGSETTVFDLNGQTMLPGFVDSHGHVILGGLQALSANLLAPPDGDVKDIPSLQDTLRAWISDNKGTVEKVRLIVGFGYDESQLEEKRAPTRADLDLVSDDIPIYIVHQSGHFGVANSAALEATGITADSEAPPLPSHPLERPKSPSVSLKRVSAGQRGSATGRYDS